MNIALRKLQIEGTSQVSPKPAFLSSRSSYVLVFCTALILYVVTQREQLWDVIRHLGLDDTDDAMRLLSVRGLLAGQSWYDMTQYRVLPPEGISLHWSRYLDAPLAGLLWLTSAVVEPAIAERIVAVLWPFGMFVAYIALVGTTARRLFGLQAGCYAILAAGLAPAIGWFAPGRLDHHNVQVLAILALVSALTVGERSRIAAGIAGAIAAMSLAIGLETVPLVAGVGLALTVQYISCAQHAREQLAAFGLSLGIFALALFVGQTAPALWFVSTCDSLSTPWLALTSAGAMSSLIWFVAGGVLRTWQLRAALVFATGFVGCLLLLPLLQGCIMGPYANLPEEQKAVIGNIIEALPVHRVLAEAPSSALAMIGPLAAAALAVMWFVVRRDRSRVAGNWALAVISVALWIGLLLSEVQTRALIIGMAVLPVATGFIGSRLTESAGIPSSIFKIASKAGVGSLLVAQTWFLIGLVISPIDKVGMSDSSCLQPSQIAMLNTLGPVRVLAPLNFGPYILLHTHHTVLSAPYHRSAPAMINGTVPFAGDERVMLETVRQYDAGLIVVCRDQTYRSVNSIGTSLARGEGKVWLERVDLQVGTSLVVWRVIHGKAKGS